MPAKIFTMSAYQPRRFDYQGIKAHSNPVMQIHILALYNSNAVISQQQTWYQNFLALCMSEELTMLLVIDRPQIQDWLLGAYTINTPGAAAVPQTKYIK